MSSFAFTKEFSWGKSREACRRFVANLFPAQREGSDSGTEATFFSFWRKSDGKAVFEARCITDCGEVLFRAVVTLTALELFQRKLEAVCRRLSTLAANWRRGIRSYMHYSRLSLTAISTATHNI